MYILWVGGGGCLGLFGANGVFIVDYDMGIDNVNNIQTIFFRYGRPTTIIPVAAVVSHAKHYRRKPTVFG